MKYHVYGALVFTFLVSPLFLPVGCSGSVDEGDACSVETAKICSEARNEILICTNGVWTSDMTCTDGTICEIRGEGPECVVDSGTGGSGGGAGTGGSGGSVGVAYCVDYTLFSTTCFPEPEFRKVATLDIEGSTITYTMTVGGLPATPPPTFPTQYDFDVDAAGTLSGMTATGTGEFVSGTATQDPACNAPEARLSFDIDFDDGTLATYNGTINFDFTLDANCGSSICFASASVTGGPCN